MDLKSSQLVLCCIAGLAVLASLLVLSDAAKTKDPFYIIAHMANNVDSLGWAAREGANAIQVDVQFDEQGKPRIFEHGGFCVCMCDHQKDDHICSFPLANQCSGMFASCDPERYLRYVAESSRVALLIMSGKVNPRWGSSRLNKAGSNLVALGEKSLFAQGYKGKVIISAEWMRSHEFLQSAAKAAAKTSHGDRYYFTFDGEQRNYTGVVANLTGFTRNRVYGTGVDLCRYEKAFYSPAIKEAVSGVRSGQVGMSYVYTVDSVSLMRTYIDLGVHGIITNTPAVLRKVAKANGLRIAKQGDSIPIGN